MQDKVIDSLLSGMYVMGYLIAGLFFLRYWRASRDKLFLYFTTAFWLLGVQRFLLGISEADIEDQTVLYAIRLLAFLIILWGILEKNLQTRKS